MWCYLSVNAWHECPKARRTTEYPCLGGKTWVFGRPEALSNLGLVGTRYTRQHRVGGLGWKSTLGSLLGVGHSLGDPRQHEVRVEGAAWLGPRVGVPFGPANPYTLGGDARRGVILSGDAFQFVLGVAHWVCRCVWHVARG